jgi:diguanylate cyclase
MLSKPSTPPAGVLRNPVDVAREAFRRLAATRTAPTPQAYREVYDAITGASALAPPAPPPAPAPDHGAEIMLQQFAGSAAAGQFGPALERAVKARHWDECRAILAQLGARPAAAAPIEAPDTPPARQARLLRDLLGRTLGLAMAGMLADSPALAQEAEDLATALREPVGEAEFEALAQRLKQLCYQIELHSDDAAERQELLLKLFHLLLENVGGLVDDDSWLHGQIAALRELIAGPLEVRALEEATRSLKQVIFQQGQLQHSLADVKLTVKNMMLAFIDRLGLLAASTGDFHEKINGFSGQIGRADNIGELNAVLGEVLRETRAVQGEALQARDNMLRARQDAQDAEQRVHQLEAQLQQMSELVREDQLTGSLNRRGLDEVFERESARCTRRGTPLCIAMLDLDDFKRLNDRYGHLAGDAALKHLVKIVKDTLRTMDVIARFGGEEFLILLPETTLESAAQTMTRLQRELTRHFFLHDNEKVLITFSAGVALRAPEEALAQLVERADQAMYQAKHSGKNRVIVAAPAPAPA